VNFLASFTDCIHFFVFLGGLFSHGTRCRLSFNESNCHLKRFIISFCKNILGVHKKSSNFAAKCELGRSPVLNFITIFALKYFNRLKQLPSDRLLGEVYEVDKSLFIDGHRSWQKFIHNSLQNLNLTSLDFDINKINQLLTDQHSKVTLNKLQHLSTQEHDNKLFFFANIYPKDFIFTRLAFIKTSSKYY
jgi:hypothetical protein